MAFCAVGGETGSECFHMQISSLHQGSDVRHHVLSSSLCHDEHCSNSKTQFGPSLSCAVSCDDCFLFARSTMA